MQFIRFADLKFWSQSAIVVNSSSGPHICWLAEFVLVRHWCWEKSDVASSVLECCASSTRGNCYMYLVKMGLVYSIGMVWLTVGLILSEPGSKSVHVLILLLSNQVENESRVSGWLGKWGEHFPCFPSWGISVSKKIYMYFVTQSS